jgi:hypothetical protein
MRIITIIKNELLGMVSLNETNETNEMNITAETANTKEDTSLLSISNSIDLILETHNGEIQFESLFIDHAVPPRKIEESFSSDK